MREGSVNMKNKKHTILIVALVLSLSVNLLLLALHAIGTQENPLRVPFPPQVERVWAARFIWP